MSNLVQQAESLVHGDRQKDYGHPIDNHGLTANLISSFLSKKYGIQLQLSPEDICWINILQKISRETNAHKQDNLLDVIGYVLNLEMIEKERKIRETNPIYIGVVRRPEGISHETFMSKEI